MLKKVFSDESGRALVLALVILGIGALLIPVFLSHASTNLLATRATEEGLKEQYAADSGIEYALWQLQNGVLEEQEGYAINNKGVEVTWREYISPTYVITSTATSYDGSSTTIVSYVQIVKGDSDGSSGSPVFDYAVAALGSDKGCDIDFGGNSEIESDVELEGDVYANGNICLFGNAEVDGDASATGEITISGNAEIKGEQTEGAPPLVGPEVDTAGYKAEAENVECAVCGDIVCDDIVCGDITRWGNWSPSSGDYEYPEHVQGNLNISGIGTFTFGDTVCVDQNFNISSITTVTFEGPVKVVGNLDISTLNTVTFKDMVCVEGDLGISSEVIFEGGVKVGGKLDISGNDEVTFGDTVCVGIGTNEDLIIEGNTSVTFDGSVKVEGKLDVFGNTEVTFGNTVGDTVCVDGDLLKTSGNSSVTFAGPIKVTEGDLNLKGNNDVLFGDTIYVGGDLNISGNKTVELGGTVYVYGEILMTGNSDELVGGEAVIAEGDIRLTGNSNFNEAAEDLPFIVSTGGDITTLGNSDVAAVIYALNGHVYLSGNSDVYGSVVGLSVTGQGNNDVVYPIDLRYGEDLPGGSDGGGDEGGSLEIITYNIYP